MAFNKYHQQKHQLLGSRSLENDSNSAVTTEAVWNINLNSEATILRIISEYSLYMRYDNDASSTDWDYVISDNGVLELNLQLNNANSISLIASNYPSNVHVAQY